MKNNFRKKISLVGLAAFLLASVFSFVGPAAKADSPAGGQYTIKLESAADFGLMLDCAKNLRRRFVGSQSDKFKNIYTFELTCPLEQLKQTLQNKYEYLETNRILQSESVTVNDPGFDTNGLNIDKEWGLIKSGFNQAWDKTTGSKDNIVAIVDTGIDETHEDLKQAKYVTGFDFVSHIALPAGGNSDDNGHGTLVAGILGATANNGIGIAGTNWQITLMPLKALDASGKGDVTAVAEAIVWATDHGAQFINLSIGGIGFGHDTALADSITYAFNRNILLVAAAGNDGSSTGSNLDQNPVFPICDDNNFNMVLGVSAVDQNDLKPEFANYGRNCIDVSAPGKRILSTINYDPLTKKSAPNSYAYASGTSLAVPFVVGQAALIRALYPYATNVQIRDRIISTADAIDALNLTQCSGSSCRGMLGAGRVNVAASLSTIISQNLSEGELVKDQSSGAVYQILGGQKRLVSTFVLNQKFSGKSIKAVTSSDLSLLPQGNYITPNDGTLIKLDNDPAVYIISNGQKLPITYQVFTQRKMSFFDVNTLSYPEVVSWPTGSFYPPIDGTLVKAAKNQTVYWVVGQVLHPVNYAFYKERGLNVFSIMVVSDKDVSGFAKGEAYIR